MASRIENEDSEQEEGEVSSDEEEQPQPTVNNKCSASSNSSAKSTGSSASSSSDEESSSDSEFDDGYDDNLMGDEEDRKRLNGLSEKERETEIFKRIEQRDVMRTRWEIERKLKLARRAEKERHTKTGEHKKKTKRKKALKKKTMRTYKADQSPALLVSPGGQSTEKTDLSISNNVNAVVENSNQVVRHDQVRKDVDTVGDDNGDNDEDEDGVIDDKNSSGELPMHSNVEYFDPKERSKERKKTVEMNRTDDKRSNAMALLKAKREDKAKREEEEARRQAQQEREEEKDELESVSGGKSARKLKASEIYSDDSGSSDWDDDEKPSGKRSRSSSSSSKSSSGESEDEQEKVEKTPAFISTRDELNKLRLSRFKMERFINLPIFEQTVTSCFVRISIGNNNQRPVYRVAEIVGVVETAKIYTLGKTRTNRGIKLKHGTQERVFRLEFISNQDFTESEFEKWRAVCEQQSVPFPTVSLIERKQEQIRAAMNYEFKDEEVAKLIEEKNRFRNRPTNYAMRKTCLMKERDAAMLRGEYEVANDLSSQIEELETRASELDKKRSSSISSISYINDRNRKRNVEDAERAIMEEVKANRGLRISDPFTRRITQPRMGFRSNDKREFLEPEPPTKSTSPPPEKKQMIETPIGNNKATTSAKADNGEMSLYSLHDFDIDLDVPLPVNPVNVLPKPTPKINEATPKRSLNLEDYKKKRGLI